MDRKEYQHNRYLEKREQYIAASKKRYQENKEKRKAQQHALYLKKKSEFLQELLQHE